MFYDGLAMFLMGQCRQEAKKGTGPVIHVVWVGLLVSDLWPTS